MPGSHVLPKARLLRDLGFGGDIALAEEALQQAGLSHPGKLNIHPSKCDEVAAVIEERFLLVCGRGDCQGAARASAGDRVVVPALLRATTFCTNLTSSRHGDRRDADPPRGAPPGP